MADTNYRGYRGSGANTAAEADHAAADFGRDPLAELARLIGQSDPAEQLNRPRANSAELLEHVASESAAFDRPVHEGYQEPQHYEATDQYGTTEHDVAAQEYDHSEQYAEPQYAEPQYAEAPPVASYPPLPAQQPAYEAYDSAALPAIAEHHQLPALAPQEPGVDYETDEQWQEGYADGQSDYVERYDDRPVSAMGGRTALVMAVAAVGLMVLGSGGAFAYRAMFGGKLLPSLPPIIMASGGPNKIVPAQTGSASQANADKPGGPDKLVTREEQPVQVQPTNPPPSTVVSTVLVTPTTTTLPPVSPVSPFPQVASPALPQVTAPPAAPAQSAAVPEPKKIHTVAIHSEPAGTAAARARVKPLSAPPARAGADEPLALVPAAERGATREPIRTQVARAEGSGATEPAATGSGGGYAVQLTSQRTEAEAQAAYRSLRTKFPQELGSHAPIIRRADLGAKGTYYRALVGPYGSAEAAAEVCSKLKAAGGSCIVQRN
jgi:hypothetical protein